MPAQLRVVMTGEEQKLFSALQNIIGQSDKADDSFRRNKKTASESEKAALRSAKAQAKAARDGAKLADTLTKKHETLNESYIRRKSAIEEAGKAGVKSESEVAAAVKLLKKEVLAEARVAKQEAAARADAIEKGTDAYRSQQKEIQRGVEKVKALEKANQSLEDQHDELKRSIKAAYDAGKISSDEYKTSIFQLGEEHKRLKKKQQDNFGDGSIANVKKYARSFLTIASAVEFVRKALELLAREREKALGSTETLKEARTRLTQVSGGSSQEFQRLTDLADEAAIKGGFTRERGAQLAFDAKSAGVDDKIGFIAEGNSFVDSNTQIELFAKTKKLFKGQFSGEELLNATAAAASESLLNVEEIIRQSPKVAAGGKAQGIDPREQLALLSVATDETESADKAANLLRTFFLKTARRDEFKDKSTFQIVDEIEKLEGDADKNNDFIKGSDELFQAFELLKNVRKSFDGRVKLISEAIDNTGTDKDIRTLALRSRFDQSTDIGRIEFANLQKNQAEIELERENELKSSVAASKAARALANNTKNALHDNLGERTASDIASKAANYVTGDEQAISLTGKFSKLLFSLSTLHFQTPRLGLENVRADLEAKRAQLLTPGQPQAPAAKLGQDKPDSGPRTVQLLEELVEQGRPPSAPPISRPLSDPNKDQ